MNAPVARYVTYASRPSAEGPVGLRARLFLPEAPEGPMPVLVWFHSGGFRTGDIDAAAHARLARQIGRHGYASAFVQYRLRARAEDLAPATRAMLPDLQADAERHFPELNRDFTGAAALAAMEDGAAFLQWLAAEGAAHGLSGHIVLGGSSAGAMTVLNLLQIAPQLGHDLPPISSAIVLSGAFAYPSHGRPCDTRTLALHGTFEPQIPPAPIRAYAHRADVDCALIEHADHQHGDPRITREEPLRRAIRRMAVFDRGEPFVTQRADRPAGWARRESRICIFTCVRNEGPFLLEWIAHNRAIGVTDFVIFSNDCDDGTTELLDALDARGIVKHVLNPSMALESDQHLNLAVHCAQYTRPFRQCDYAILTDVDEFIQIDCADRTLNGLLAVTGYPDVISLSELLFGFGGVERYENRLVAAQFTTSDTLTLDGQNPRRGVKSIMRITRDVAAYSNHRPQIRPEALERIHWVDGSGQPVPRDFMAEGRRGLPVTGRYRLARVNHYTLRSGESMLVKFQRGDAVRPGRMREKYFRERNAMGMYNTDMADFIPGITRELGKLLKDPEILRLHKECVARHKARIAALKSDPAMAGIWQAIREEVARSAGIGPQAEATGAPKAAE